MSQMRRSLHDAVNQKSRCPKPLPALCTCWLQLVLPTSDCTVAAARVFFDYRYPPSQRCHDGTQLRMASVAEVD